MSRTRIVMATLGALGALGLAACEDNVAEIDTGDGEIQLEEDGDIDVED